MLKRGWTTHIVNLSSKKRRVTTSNIKTLPATYHSVLHVKVSSFTAIKPPVGCQQNLTEHCIEMAQKRLETKWEGLVTILSLVSKLPRKWSQKKFLPGASPMVSNSLVTCVWAASAVNVTSKQAQKTITTTTKAMMAFLLYYSNGWKLKYFIYALNQN